MGAVRWKAAQLHICGFHVIHKFQVQEEEYLKLVPQK